MIQRFIKMHGAGNDYIFINCLASGQELSEPDTIAKILSRRHFSIGADGVVFILPSSRAHARMRIFNSDGSEGATCGNALRCVAKLLYESANPKKSHVKIETESGIRDIFITVTDGKVGAITVDMGIAEPRDTYLLNVKGEKHSMREIFIGNRHQVTFVPDVDSASINEIGNRCEFSRGNDGINTEFCEMISKNHLRVRTFERGSGETLACGSGACASAVASILIGHSDYNVPIRVSMRGGDLFVICDREMRVFLSGNACKAFEGTVEI